MLRLKHLVLQLSLLSFFCVVMPMPAQAAVLSTGDYLAMSERQTYLDTVTAALEREDVRRYLIGMGVDPDDALARVAGLPDRELQQVAGELENLPAGGSVLALVGAVFIVLLILELVGVINIFGKV